jgi:hypothetical protein
VRGLQVIEGQRKLPEKLLAGIIGGTGTFVLWFDMYLHRCDEAELVLRVLSRRSGTKKFLIW